MHILVVPSFFATRTTGLAHGLDDGFTTPSDCISSIILAISCDDHGCTIWMLLHSPVSIVVGQDWCNQAQSCQEQNTAAASNITAFKSQNYWPVSSPWERLRASKTHCSWSIPIPYIATTLSDSLSARRHSSLGGCLSHRGSTTPTCTPLQSLTQVLCKFCNGR